MNKFNPEHKHKTDALRQAAERRMGDSRANTREMSAEEVARLVYELEVHHEELEIQNEELRRAQLELKDARDRYLDLYDFAPVSYLTLNATGEIVEVNQTACDLLGDERLRLIGMRLLLYFDVGSRAELRAHLDEVVATGKRQSTELRLNADGKPTVHLESCRATGPDDAPYCRIGMTDVTARILSERQLHEQATQLAQFARINTMGEMVAGIAHEISQPLHAISNFASACERQLSQSTAPHEEIREMLHEIAGQAVRTGDIIRGLRELVKRTQLNRSAISIRDVIAESVKLIAPETRRREVAVHVVLEGTLANAIADRVQIEQVVVNLLRNACEAMDLAVGQRSITVRAVECEDRIEVAVEDVGQGLAADGEMSIFDAFQTTKAEGMGLGLAISRSIIEMHGGKIWATPNSGGGTVFHFTLPVGSEASRHVE